MKSLREALQSAAQSAPAGLESALLQLEQAVEEADRRQIKSGTIEAIRIVVGAVRREQGVKS